MFDVHISTEGLWLFYNILRLVAQNVTSGSAMRNYGLTARSITHSQLETAV